MKSIVFLLFTFFAGNSWNGIKNICQHWIDEAPKVRIDDHLQGIWKLADDTDFHNYFILEKVNDYKYSITYMNRSGNNRGLEHGIVYFSEIDNVKFLNVSNWDWDHHGLVFLKIKEITPGSWDMTANLVIDTTLSQLNSSEALCEHIRKRLKDPLIYGKELHFRKKFEFNSY